MPKTATAMYMSLRMPKQEPAERMFIDATQMRWRETFFDRWQETTAELSRP